MFPGPALRPRLSAVGRVAGLLAIAAIVAGCGAAFDAAGPCPPDGRAPGAYPELEALVPAELEGRPPDRLDSGRNCTEGALGTLASHGVSELRFGGGIWPRSGSSGVTFAVLEADGLRPDWVAEFYEAGARAGRNVEELTASRDAAGGRIDVLNRESYQTVIVRSTGSPDRVSVLLVASFIREIQTREAHEALVEEALAALLAPG